MAWIQKKRKDSINDGDIISWWQWGNWKGNEK
jgi:hypothetical protein